MKNKFLSLLFLFISTVCFAKLPNSTADSISTFVRDRFVEVGSTNLNQLIRSNNDNDSKGESSKNRYVFNFNQVLNLSLPDGRFVKDLTPYDYKSRLSPNFEDELNERLVEINNQLDQGKPKIYVGFDGFLGQAITATLLQEIKGGVVTFSDFENEVKKNVKYIKKWDQVEAAYKNIFTQMEGSVDLSKNPEGVEIIRMGVFDEIKLQSYENELKPIAKTWVSRNFEYFKGTGVNDPLRIRLYDTDIRPSVFTDLSFPSSIKSATNSENYNSKAIIDFLDKFATNIKEALKGNLKALNCTNFSSNVQTITVAREMLDHLLKFDEKCFAKLSLEDRIYILNVINQSWGLTDKTGFFEFFKKLYKSGYGGENVTLATILTTPKYQQKLLLEELRSHKLFVDLVEKLDGENRQDFCLTLASFATSAYPFDNNFDGLLLQKKAFRHEDDGSFFNAGTYFNIATGSVTKSISKDGNLYAIIHIGSGTQYEEVELNPFQPIGIITSLKQLPGIPIVSKNKYIEITVPAVYLYWLNKELGDKHLSQSLVVGGSFCGLAYGVGLIAGEATVLGYGGMTATLFGSFEVLVNTSNIFWEVGSIKTKLTTKFGTSGTQFGEKIENCLTVANYVSVGAGLTDLVYNLKNASIFWIKNRKQIKNENILSNEDFDKIEDLFDKTGLAKKISYWASSGYNNIDNWLNGLTTSVRNDIEAILGKWTNKALASLEHQIGLRTVLATDITTDYNRLLDIFNRLETESWVKFSLAGLMKRTNPPSPASLTLPQSFKDMIGEITINTRGLKLKLRAANLDTESPQYIGKLLDEEIVDELQLAWKSGNFDYFPPTIKSNLQQLYADDYKLVIDEPYLRFNGVDSKPDLLLLGEKSLPNGVKESDVLMLDVKYYETVPYTAGHQQAIYNEIQTNGSALVKNTKGEVKDINGFIIHPKDTDFEINSLKKLTIDSNLNLVIK